MKTTLYGKTRAEIDDMSSDELSDWLLERGGVYARGLLSDVTKWASGMPGCYRLPDDEDEGDND